MSNNKEHSIGEFLQLESAREASPQPVFFDLNKSDDQEAVQKLFDRESVVIRDPLEEQLMELTIARNPQLLPLDSEFAEAYEALKEQIIDGKPSSAQVGIWVYLPWRRVLTHLLDEELYFELRTSYNREIIDAKEQETIRKGRLGIAGLSTGNMVALTIALQGACQALRLADSDILELANMNRIRAGIDAIGELKTTITAKHIYEVDPFADIALFSDGLHEENIDSFIEENGVLNVIVDTVDNIRAKALIRLHAKKHHVPVVSIINNGNDVLLDIERYDEEPDLAPFNGGLGAITESFLEKHDKMSPQAQVRLAAQLLGGHRKEKESRILKEKMRPDEQARLLAQLMGPPNVSPRLQHSLLMAGKHVFSWPQVSNAVSMSSGVAAFAVRRILLNEKLSSGRYQLSAEGLFDPSYNNQETKQKRLQELETFLGEIL